MIQQQLFTLTCLFVNITSNNNTIPKKAEGQLAVSRFLPAICIRITGRAVPSNSLSGSRDGRSHRTGGSARGRVRQSPPGVTTALGKLSATSRKVKADDAGGEWGQGQDASGGGKAGEGSGGEIQSLAESTPRSVAQPIIRRIKAAAASRCCRIGCRWIVRRGGVTGRGLGLGLRK